MSSKSIFPKKQAAKSARSFVRLTLPAFWSSNVEVVTPAAEKLSKCQVRALFAEDLRAETFERTKLHSA